MGKVFINYRRGLSKDACRHLASLLAGHLDTPLDKLRGRSRVFIDLKGIDGFSDWFTVLKDQVAGSAAMISVIGPGWPDARDKDGNRRLDNPDDFVRFEIREAASRGIPVLPVLLDGAALPARDELPADMHGLLTRQAMPLGATHFERDARDIARRLRGFMPRSSGVSRGVAAAVAVAGVAGGIAVERYWLAETLPTNVVDLRRALRETQRERDTATGKLTNAERTVSDIEARLKEAEDALAAAKSEAAAQREAATRAEVARKAAEATGQKADAARQDAQRDLAAANAKLAEATGSVTALQKELERAKSQAVASVTDDAARGKRAGDTFQDCWQEAGKRVCGPQMVVIPASSFTMGSPEGEEGRDTDEGPQRTVSIAKPFAAGQFEVTFAEWDACVAAGGCKHKPEDEGWRRDDRPVINVSWNDITGEYLPWLSGKTGKTYRLLTEAEWEYAARAGTIGPFSFEGKISAEKANYYATYTYDGSAKGEYRRKTVPVKSFQPNPWGLYQVHGNVWEWVQDCKTDYKDAPRDGSAAPTTKDCPRVLRGGSWDISPQLLRSAYRGRRDADYRSNYSGFRVARTLTP